MLFPAATDIAVYGNCVSGATGGLPPVIPGTTWAGYFDGDVNINGQLFVNGIWTASDQMFKTNVDSIPNSLTIIKQLKPKTYFMDTVNGNAYGMVFPKMRQYGFLAQDVETILPAMVATKHKQAMVDSAGTVVLPAVDYKTINYQEFIPLLTRGMQEQSIKMDSLQTTNSKQDSINKSLQHQIDSIKTTNSNMQDQINQLSQMINDCCSANHNHSPINMNNGNGNINNSTSSTNIKLTDSQSISLSQNEPNPYSEMTTINYFLTEEVSKAQMLFFNSNGKLIQSVELTQRGLCALNVFASDLSNGLYTYTLVVDGKIVATKKMVKQ